MMMPKMAVANQVIMDKKEKAWAVRHCPHMLLRRSEKPLRQAHALPHPVPLNQSTSSPKTAAQPAVKTTLLLLAST